MVKVETHKHNFSIQEKITSVEDLVLWSIEEIKGGNIKSLISLCARRLNPLLSLFVYSEQHEGVYRALFSHHMKYYIQLFLDCSLAVFKLSTSPGIRVEIELCDEKFKFEGKELKEGIDTGDWRLAFAWAIISRNNNALNKLLKIPEGVMRKSILKGDEYHFLYVDF